MLAFLEKLTLQPDSVSASDIKPLRAEGLSSQAIEDAIHVCTLFNVYDRLADSFAFEIPDDRGFAMSASTLLKRGYV
jgi:alkylhydroperoxidase family enzyme